MSRILWSGCYPSAFMCGIAGIIHESNQLPLTQRISVALDALRTRGPDDNGTLFFDQRASITPAEQAIGVLGSRRLAILDTSSAGHQPMTSADGSVSVVFNGEIFNYVELRDELRALGHSFRSQSDTEVILAAFRQWGVSCIRRFTGMFAFGLLNHARRELFLARDPFGIKPLYYATAKGQFAFASQISALLGLFDLPRRPNTDRLHEFLVAGWVDHGDETLFSDIHQLAPGHTAQLSLDTPHEVRIRRSWEIPQSSERKISFEDAADEFRSIFLKSVKLHLRSDVPVACALSGGLDSSSIVSSIRHTQGKDYPLHTFTFVASSGGKDLEWSEEPWADLVGKHTNATMHKVHASLDSLRDEFEGFLLNQDSPVWSPVVWTQQQIFKAAHEEGFKAMLSGQGSDEVLAGYNRHIAARAASLLKGGRLVAAKRLIENASQLPGVTKMTFTRSALVDTAPAWLRNLKGRISLNITPWMNAGWFESHSDWHPHFERGTDVLKSVLRDDLKRSPLPALLRYEDRNSMAYSIDNRLPYLTPEIVEFVFALPQKYLVSDSAECKSLLRYAMRDIVPAQTLARKDKQGFPVPVVEWLQQLRPWAEQWLGEAAKLPIFSAPVLRQTSARFFSQSQPSVAEAFLMWRWIFTAGWVKVFRVEF